MVSPETLPFVRVVLLDFNGGETIVEAIAAVSATRWPADRLEIVCVDNGSTDGSLEEIERRFPNVLTVQNGKNLGFPGNNVAMRNLGGVDYVALVNSDAIVEQNWLAPLVDRASSDESIGAVSPKILLADRFVEIPVTIRGAHAGSSTPIVVRGVSVNGEDVFGRTHVASGGGRSSDRTGIFERLSDTCTLRVPVLVDVESGSLVQLQIEVEAFHECVLSLAGSEQVEFAVLAGDRLSISLAVGTQTVDVVNNVGSWLDDSWVGHERGLYEVDAGQYDNLVDIGTWCGAAVLLRARHLEDVGVFEESFFLYYEDTDLAVRGRGRGWRFVLEPTSVVRHIHSASTIEGSSVAAHYIERNRLLLVVRHAPASAVFREFAQFLIITASYLRSVCKQAIARRQAPDFTNVGRRLRSYFSALRLLPASVASRRRISTQRYVTRDELHHRLQLGSVTVAPGTDGEAGVRSSP